MCLVLRVKTNAENHTRHNHTRALREIGVLSGSETPNADDAAYCEEALGAAIAELATQGITATIDADAIPDAVFLPFATLLASEVASHFTVPGPSRAGAIGRIRAYYLTDDRTDRRDTNNDGVISDDEATAGLYTAYY